MRKDFDAIVIGAGLLGCFTARALSRYRIRVAVLEAREDVCTGISKANTAIVYDGHDTKPGTLKTEMCVRANRGFNALCRDLGVRFSRCGALTVCFGERGASVLRKKFEQGQENGVEGLELLTPQQVLALEPDINPEVYLGLWSPNTGTVNPWELCTAAYENALHNGVDFFFDHAVDGISPCRDGYCIRCGDKEFYSKGIINCAGLFSDEVREMLCAPTVRIYPQTADYLVTDTGTDFAPRHIIFHEPEHKGKGLTLVPTLDGNLLIGPSEQPSDNKLDFSSTPQGLSFLRELCPQLFPKLEPGAVIRNFSSLRPNPFYVQADGDTYSRDGRSISSFTILQEASHPAFISLLGIKTPGLSCAWELGCHVAQRLAESIHCREENPNFDPHRPSPIRLEELSETQRAALIEKDPAYGRILCRCRGISEGEVLDAIRRGATTLDGVKRRVGSSMGRCQGSYCSDKIMELLARERGISVYELCKDGKGRVLGGSRYEV